MICLQTNHFKKFKTAVISLELGHVLSLELKLELVRNQGDELRICRFSLGIADGIAEEPLQGIQIPSVPGYFDGMPDSPLHTAGCGLECLGHLGVQYLGDGVGVPYGPPGEPPGCSRRTLQRLNANVDDLLLSLSSRSTLLYGFENMIAK